MERRDASRTASTLTRRECLTCFAAAGIGACLGSKRAEAGPAPGTMEAAHAVTLGGGRTRCSLCPNHCVRSPGDDGRCRARGNRGGTYYSLVYGQPCVLALDPVEKCPLHHLQLGGKVLSIATAGCNLSCSYCQNWVFSQAGPDDVPRSFRLGPDEVVARARVSGAVGVCFFYTEPTVYFEYMLDIARAARARGLATIMVTAGYINPEPMAELLPHLDAVTLGLKGFNDDFYRDVVGGELRHVRATVERLAAAPGMWWEVVNLVVPSLNDDMDEIAAMASWLGEVAGAERPLHFTRFRPEYRLRRLPMTPAATLTRARETALAQGLRHVYVGNMPGHEGANTFCPGCGQVVVERLAFTILEQHIDSGRCTHCGRTIGGLWS